jgi:glucose-6-phosphate isomerase
MVYFFEKAAASGVGSGVNPFDSARCELTKEIFALLGKPGFEKEKAELEKRLS